jgi:hypothetical protein
MFKNHRAWCGALLGLVLAGCQTSLIGDTPGTPDSGSASDSSTPGADAYQPTSDAAPLPDAPPPPPPPPPDAPPPPPACDEGDDQVVDPTTGHCYFVNRALVTWAVAMETCYDLGGYLVTVTSEAENDLILPLAGTVDNWMGGNDIVLEERWVWLNGDLLGYNNWRSGEPNNSSSTDPNGEDCMIIEGARSGSWDDRSCLRNYGFICERD